MKHQPPPLPKVTRGDALVITLLLAFSTLVTILFCVGIARLSQL